MNAARTGHLLAGRAEPPPLSSVLSPQLCRVPLSLYPPRPCLTLPCHPGSPGPEEARRGAAHQQERPRLAVAARLAGPVILSWGTELCTGGRALGTVQPQLVHGTHARHWPWGHRS